MKPLKYAPNKTIVHLSLVTQLFAVFLCGGLLGACENDIQKIHSFTKSDTLPDVTGNDFQSIYSDSSKVKARVVGKEIRQFNTVERPYIEFPQGMQVWFYDDSLNVTSTITANYVIYYREEGLWEAKYDVEGRNLKTNEQLNTEHLYWDENKQLIYSNTYSRIVNEDGTFYGQNGFEANQDFTWWKLKGTKGTVNVKDE